MLDELKSDPLFLNEDILALDAMNRYYQYYFYARKDDMSYKVSKNSSIERSDNLFSLLSDNALSVQEYLRVNKDSALKLCMKQSFMASSKEFKAIDSITRGVIVSYGVEGETLINNLCSSSNIEKEFKLIRQAQRYSVNLFHYLIDKLAKSGMIREIQEGTGILYLDKHHYSDEFGLCENLTYEMETLII